MNKNKLVLYFIIILILAVGTNAGSVAYADEVTIYNYADLNSDITSSTDQTIDVGSDINATGALGTVGANKILNGEVLGVKHSLNGQNGGSPVAGINVASGKTLTIQNFSNIENFSNTYTDSSSVAGGAVYNNGTLSSVNSTLLVIL